MVTRNIPVLTEADLLAGGGTVGSNGTFATAGSTFTYNAATMPWYTMVIDDTGADTTTLSPDTDGVDTDGGPNIDNEGTDGETGTLFDPGGTPVGTPGELVAADRSGVLNGSDGSVITIYEIENFDDIDVYAFSAPLVDGVTYTTVSQNPRDQQVQYSQMMCLTAGTLIATPGGPVPVEALCPGDLVMTADHGAQPLRWIGGAEMSQAQLSASPHLRPVRVRRGTLGARQDLLVSPQHRILIGGDRHGRGGAFTAARLLAEEADGRFRIARGLRRVRYLNLLFDRHEVIFADGVAVESLYPGPMALRGCAPDDLWRLYGSRPALIGLPSLGAVQEVFGPFARPILGRSELRALWHKSAGQAICCAQAVRAVAADQSEGGRIWPVRSSSRNMAAPRR